MKNNIYACLEIGCAESRIIICNIRQERLYVLSHAEVQTEGIEQGNVVNVNQVVGTLKTLKQKVEQDLNQEIQGVLLSIPSIDINLDNVKTSVSLKANKPINSSEIKQLFRNIINQPIYRDQIVVNVVPRAFVVDEKNLIQNPIGIIGQNLMLRAQKITASSSLVYNLINVVELAGFRITDIMLGSMAESMYALTVRQSQEGTCLINIGHSMTTVTVINEGKLLCSISLSIGGQTVTEDIAKAFNIDESMAEQLKISFGHANCIEGISEIVYTEEKSDDFICITRQALSDVITSRYESILKLVKQYLTENGYKHDSIHYVFTGGASELDGLGALAKAIYGQEIVVFRPSMLGVRHSRFVNLIGMATFGHEMSMLTGQKNNCIDFEAYVETTVVSSKENQKKQPIAVGQTKQKSQEKSFMDNKLENSGVLVRIFDMIFDEKEE
ncbi:MAG: cell division protein FtsA [Turicibacter sp.]